MNNEFQNLSNNVNKNKENSFDEFLLIKPLKNDKIIDVEEKIPKILKTRKSQIEYIKKQDEFGKKQLSAFIKNENMEKLDILIKQYEMIYKIKANRSTIINMIIENYLDLHKDAKTINEYNKQRLK